MKFTKQECPKKSGYLTTPAPYQSFEIAPSPELVQQPPRQGMQTKPGKMSNFLLLLQLGATMRESYSLPSRLTNGSTATAQAQEMLNPAVMVSPIPESTTTAAPIPIRVLQPYLRDNDLYDISAEQLESDIRLIDSIDISDFGDFSAFSARGSETSHQIQKRSASDQSLQAAVDLVMTDKLPPHMHAEFAYIKSSVVHIFLKNKSFLPGVSPGQRQLIASYLEFCVYLGLIVIKEESNRGAYYYLQIKRQELIRLAAQYGIDLWDMTRPYIEKAEGKIARSKTKQATLERNPGDIYDAYIEKIFPDLHKIGLRGGDRIVYSLAPAYKKNIHFASIAEVLDGENGELLSSELSFYSIEGYGYGFPDKHLDRFLASLKGSQFRQFKMQHLVAHYQVLLEEHLAEMEHTPIGFNPEHLLDELIERVNDTDPMTAEMQLELRGVLTQPPPALTQKEAIIDFAAMGALANLMDSHPEFEGMDMNALAETHFVYAYQDKDGITRYDTASLFQILRQHTDPGSDAGLVIAQRKNVRVRWPYFFNEQQKQILADEEKKLTKIADALKKRLPFLKAQTALWLLMPPSHVNLQTVLDSICESLQITPCRLSDRFGFQYGDKPLIPGSDYALPIGEKKKVEFTLMDLLIGQKRLFERDQWFLSAHFIYPPAGFNQPPEKVLQLINALRDFPVQPYLIEAYRRHADDPAVLKAFSELRRTVERPERRYRWHAFEFKDNPNMVVYVWNPKLACQVIPGYRYKPVKICTVQEYDGRAVEILFRLSGNRYRFKTFSELAAAVKTNDKLRNDVFEQVDVEAGMDLTKLKPGSLLDPKKREPDKALLQRIVDWGAENIDKRITSANEAKYHEMLDGFALIGPVAFIPAMAFAWPVGLILGLAYSVFPPLAQSWIATREDEKAVLEYAAFKNLLMELGGLGVGIGVDKAAGKLIKLWHKGPSASGVIKGSAVNAGIKNTEAQRIFSSPKKRICNSIAPTMLCEIVAYDETIKMLKSTATSKKAANVVSKGNAIALEAIKYPATAGLDALLPTEAHLLRLGFSAISYRAVGTWPAGIDGPAPIVVVVEKKGVRYVLDPHLDLPLLVMGASDDPPMLKESQWLHHYQAAEGQQFLLYKDFARRQAAINFFRTLFQIQ